MYLNKMERVKSLLLNLNMRCMEINVHLHSFQPGGIEPQHEMYGNPSLNNPHSSPIPIEPQHEMYGNILEQQHLSPKKY